MRAVVFDFDFTLADSSVGIIESVNYALSQLGLPTAMPARIRDTIGFSLADALTRLAGPQAQEVAHAFEQHFTQRADEVMAAHTRMYDAVPTALAALRAAGMTLGIVSTKYRYRIEDILTRHRLLSHFQTIIGGEDVHQHKPDPAGLRLAMARLAVPPEDVLYVGDHIVDAEAAQRAGVPFIAVLSGTCTVEHFTPYPVRACVQDVLGVLPELGVVRHDTRP